MQSNPIKYLNIKKQFKFLGLFIMIMAVFPSHAFRLQVVKTLYIGGDSLAVKITNAANTTDKGLVFVGSVDTGGRGQIPATRHSGSELLIGKIDSNQNLSWLKTYGSSGNDVAYSITESHSVAGGYAVLGNSGANDGDAAPGYGNSDYWLLRLDNTGNKIWSKCFGSNGGDYASGIVEAPDKGFVLVGSTNARSPSGDVTSRYEYTEFSGDGLVIKVDSQGNKQWAKIVGGTGDDFSDSRVIGTTDGYYLAGTSNSKDHDCTDNSWHPSINIDNPLFWLIKIDQSGNLEWNKSYGTSAGAYLYSALLDTRDSTIILGGTTHGNDFMATGNHNFGSYLPEDMLVIKVDRSGSVLWHKMIGTAWDESLAGTKQGIIIDHKSNGYVIYGQTSASANPPPPPPIGVTTGGPALWISTIDSNGVDVDYKTFGGMSNAEHPGTLTLFKDGYAALGNTFSQSFIEGVNTSRSPYSVQDGFISYLKYPAVGIPKVVSSSNDLIISPNPSMGAIHVIIKDTRPGVFRIANINGQEMLNRKIISTPENMDIQTSLWAKGTYLANWKNDKDVQKTLKFIIN